MLIMSCGCAMALVAMLLVHSASSKSCSLVSQEPVDLHVHFPTSSALIPFALATSYNGSVVAAGFSDDNYPNAQIIRVYKRDKYNTQLGKDIVSSGGAGVGAAVSLNRDGSMLAVGMPKLDEGRGVVTIYTIDKHGDWVRVGIDLKGDAAGEQFGAAVSLSGDGNTVAVGVPKANSSVHVGEVRVLQWTGKDWLLKGQAMVSEVRGEQLGLSVELSADGLVLAVGARDLHSTQANGRVRVFKLDVFDGAVLTQEWIQFATQITGVVDVHRPGSFSLSGDGMSIAVILQDAPSRPGQANPAYVNLWSRRVGRAGDWSVLSRLDATASQTTSSVSLSYDGKMLALTSLSPDQSTNLRIYRNEQSTVWSQLVLLKQEGDKNSLGLLSDDGLFLVLQNSFLHLTSLFVPVGGLGDCDAALSLPSGESCTPSCASGFHVLGQFTCQDGVLVESASCAPLGQWGCARYGNSTAGCGNVSNSVCIDTGVNARTCRCAKGFDGPSEMLAIPDNQDPFSGVCKPTAEEPPKVVYVYSTAIIVCVTSLLLVMTSLCFALLLHKRSVRRLKARKDAPELGSQHSEPTADKHSTTENGLGLPSTVSNTAAPFSLTPSQEVQVASRDRLMQAALTPENSINIQQHQLVVTPELRLKELEDPQHQATEIIIEDFARRCCGQSEQAPREEKARPAGRKVITVEPILEDSPPRTLAAVNEQVRADKRPRPVGRNILTTLEPDGSVLLWTRNTQTPLKDPSPRWTRNTQTPLEDPSPRHGSISQQAPSDPRHGLQQTCSEKSHSRPFSFSHFLNDPYTQVGTGGDEFGEFSPALPFFPVFSVSALFRGRQTDVEAKCSFTQPYTVEQIRDLVASNLGVEATNITLRVGDHDLDPADHFDWDLAEDGVPITVEVIEGTGALAAPQET
eukprot:g77455.t1